MNTIISIPNLPAHSNAKQNAYISVFSYSQLPSCAK